MGDMSAVVALQHHYHRIFTKGLCFIAGALFQKQVRFSQPYTFIIDVFEKLLCSVSLHLS